MIDTLEHAAYPYANMSVGLFQQQEHCWEARDGRGRKHTSTKPKRGGKKDGRLKRNRRKK